MQSATLTETHAVCIAVIDVSNTAYEIPMNANGTNARKPIEMPNRLRSTAMRNNAIAAYEIASAHIPPVRPELVIANGVITILVAAPTSVLARIGEVILSVAKIVERKLAYEFSMTPSVAAGRSDAAAA